MEMVNRARPTGAYASSAKKLLHYYPPTAEEFDRDRSFAEAGRSIAASNWMSNTADEGCAALRSGEHRVAM